MLLFRPPILKFGLAGVLPAGFTGIGVQPSPLTNDAVLPADASSEWLWVLLAPLAYSNTEVNDQGGYALLSPPDGTYTQTYRGLVLPPSGAVTVYESSIVTNVGTLQVVVDQALSWNIRGAVTKDQALAWDVRGSVSKDQALAWNIRGAVTKDQPLSWNIRGAVTRDQALLWDILNGSQVVVDQPLSWNIRGAVTKDQALAWDVRGAVTKDQPLSWAIRGSLTRDQVLAWDVRNAVLRDQAIVWDILGSLQVVVDQPLSWNIRGSVVKDQALVWNIQGDSYPDPIRIRITLQQLNGVTTRVVR